MTGLHKVLLSVSIGVIVAIIAFTVLERTARRGARLRILDKNCTAMSTENDSSMSALDFVVIIRLFVVAFKQGVSIPYCLIQIGESISREAKETVHLGKVLVTAGQSLNRGTSWNDTWIAATRGIPDSDCSYCFRLAEALESAWKFGASPISRLNALSESLLEREKTEVELAGSKLNISLLIPTGLCFLPAFILIGVIPVIASFMGGK
jgi:hypothetical protein